MARTAPIIHGDENVSDNRPANMDDVNRIHTRLDGLGDELREGFGSIRDGFADMTRTLTVLTTEHGLCRKDLAYCKETLQGNGKRGLVRDSEDHEQRLATLEAAKAETKARWKWWHVTLAGCLFSALAGGVAQILGVVVKHYWP